MADRFLNDRVTLLRGDCLEMLPTLAAGSIDAVVTDPPYGLSFLGAHWDHGVPGVEFWRAALRVLKPGAHLLAFSGTRTYHRMACAIEDAGFEIRDQIGWAYGSGFPKNLDIGKAIDRAAGAVREVIGTKQSGIGTAFADDNTTDLVEVTAPATEDAKTWDGWGTALKPAWEPVCVARKPLSAGSIAANVQKHGTGALNLGACRIEGYSRDPRLVEARVNRGVTQGVFNGSGNMRSQYLDRGADGRWPANLIHDGSEEVLAGFPALDESGDSVARYFYTAKADVDDRLGSKHPTVKPLDLMQYLVRLVTAPGGVVLDPFAGTGTTGEAAWREGRHAVLIEREPAYQADIEKRMRLALTGPDTRRAASIRQTSIAGTPLFDWGAP